MVTILWSSMISYLTSDSAYCVSWAATGDCYATIQTNGVHFSCRFLLTTPINIAPNRPRVILVEDHGALVGLVTVKDVLRFTATEKLDSESWNERGGLDGILEEIWTWADGVLQHVVWWSRSIIRS